MRKIRFLQDFGIFQKDTFRVIMAENNTHYFIQTDLHSEETTPFHKSNNGIIFQVVERS